jgi:hypothetical protein
MKYLLMVCWGTERMNAQTEPDSTAVAEKDEEGFPWVDDLRARGIWLTGAQLAPPRRAKSVEFGAGRQSSRTAHSWKPRRRLEGST